MPVAAPSANRSGHVSPTLASHVADDLGDAPAFILDGGPTAHGLESTILDASEDRSSSCAPARFAADAIERLLGAPLVRRERGRRSRDRRARLSRRDSSPATMRRAHRLRLDATEVRPGEALLAFGPDAPRHDGPAFNLSPTGDLVEAAANLFAALRALDAARPAAIAVMPIPDTGLGEAINDRLRRGAAPRP